VEHDVERYFVERRVDFVRRVRQAGHPCRVYRALRLKEKPAEWERRQEDLARWVRGLEKPVGLMACTDQLGFWLIDACARAGVRVPEEAAVVGVEDDESLCAMSRPPLSSVRFNAERTGYEAAALLDALLAGRRPPRRPLLIEPVGIVSRRSSDFVAVADAPIAEALRLIRDRAAAGLTVEELLRATPLSRSSLERRMRAAIGRSPKAEILRLRYQEVKRLLSTTALSLSRIASRTGFEHVQYLCEAFRRIFGETPGRFRERTRRIAGGDP
jgi:LacI family transcriptional regulator